MDTYEKKYKEALEWMRGVYPTLTGAVKEDAEHYFPELRESEDERIRKWIKNELAKRYVEDGIVNSIDADKAFAWLEKQKELTPADGWDYADKRMSHPLYLEGFEAGRAVEREVSEQEWSEEDKNELAIIISVIEDNKADAVKQYPKYKALHNAYDRMLRFLKSFRSSWKPSEGQLDALLNILHPDDPYYYELKSLYEDLKKL